MGKSGWSGEIQLSSWSQEKEKIKSRKKKIRQKKKQLKNTENLEEKLEKEKATEKKKTQEILSAINGVYISELFQKFFFFFFSFLSVFFFLCNTLSNSYELVICFSAFPPVVLALNTQNFLPLLLFSQRMLLT